MTEKEQEGIWALISLILLIPLIFWHAYVGYKIYIWFQPENWPNISFSTFILITLLYGHYKKALSDPKFKELVPKAIIAPGLTLLLAYLSKIILDHSI